MSVLYHLAKHWKIRWGFTDAIWRLELTIILAVVLMLGSLFILLYTSVAGFMGDIPPGFAVVALLYCIGILLGVWITKLQRRLLPFAMSAIAPLMVLVIPAFAFSNCSMIEDGQPYAYIFLLLLMTWVQVLINETWLRAAVVIYTFVVSMLMLLLEKTKDNRMCADIIDLSSPIAYLLFGVCYTMLICLVSWVAQRMWRIEGTPPSHESVYTPTRVVLDDKTKLLDAIDLLRGRGIDDEVDELERLAQNATKLAGVTVMPGVPYADSPVAKRHSARSIMSHSGNAECDLYSVIESECQPLSTREQQCGRESYGLYSFCTSTGDLLGKSYESMAKSNGHMVTASSLPPETPTAWEPSPEDYIGMLPDGFGQEYNPKNESYLVVKHFETLLSEPELVQHLGKGGVLFCMACKLRKDLTESEVRLIECFVNMSSFEDEVKEAGTIPVDMRAESAVDFTFWRNTAAYYLPGIKKEDVNAAVISSYAYQKACQPSGTYVWNDVQGENTFRITKSIIPLVFKVTIQFKCSDVPEEFLPQFSGHMSGLQVHKAVLMERTRRKKGGLDVCKKCKSLLLYHFLPDGGAIVVNPVALVNTSIPSILVSIIDRVGSLGGKEVATCAKLARQYLKKEQGV
eukprot:TRINITY_DN30324_c0_g1_i1.p1 TRINITY_DN30324_c0_g1~~TRINITY_DN30324_c0_g1_i1.p1  ORF type:complete len:628 (+),score=169.28 TRINITY_DN30324_c0_g1_i1:37-1920(+)